MSEDLFDIFESSKSLKRQDVKATEKKMNKEITDEIGNNELTFLNNFLRSGEKIDGKTYKSIDALIAKYKKKIGPTKAKTDADLMLLAPIIASIYLKLKE